jgi:hypothetical protein
MSHGPFSGVNEALGIVDQLERALRWYVEHVDVCAGSDFLSDDHCAVEGDKMHRAVVQAVKEGCDDR